MNVMQEDSFTKLWEIVMIQNVKLISVYRRKGINGQNGIEIQLRRIGNGLRRFGRVRGLLRGGSRRIKIN